MASGAEVAGAALPLAVVGGKSICETADGWEVGSSGAVETARASTGASSGEIKVEV